MIYDLILQATLDCWQASSMAETFDKLFDVIGADPEEYDWDMTYDGEYTDEEDVRQFCLGKLIEAAIDYEILSDSIDMNSFDFSDGVSYSLSDHDDEEEKDEIATSISRFGELTGLTIELQ